MTSGLSVRCWQRLPCRRTRASCSPSTTASPAEYLGLSGSRPGKHCSKAKNTFGQAYPKEKRILLWSDVSYSFYSFRSVYASLFFIYAIHIRPFHTQGSCRLHERLFLLAPCPFIPQRTQTEDILALLTFLTSLTALLYPFRRFSGERTRIAAEQTRHGSPNEDRKAFPGRWCSADR